MIISHLQLDHFGKFHETELNLNPGINIIYGPNESGKSTIHAFIQCMLFGAERLRGRGAGKDAYTKYQPWELGGNYTGRLEFEHQGKHYRIVRNFHKAEASFSVIDLETGRPCLEEDQELADLIQGLTNVNYRNSISISQLSAQPDSQFAGNMQSFLANMSMSASESVDVAQAMNYLKEERKKVSAKISEAAYEKKLDRRDELKVELSGRDEMLERKENLEVHCARAQKELKDLEFRVDQAIREDRNERIKAIRLIQENNDVADMYRAKKKQLREFEEANRSTTREELEAAIEDYEDLKAEADDLHSRCAEIREAGSGGIMRNLALILPAAALTLIIYMAGGLLEFYGTLRIAVTGILGLLTLIFAVFLFSSMERGKKRLKKMEEEIRRIEREQREILDAFDAEEINDIKIRCAGWQGNEAAIAGLRKEMEALRERYDSLQEPLQPYLDKYGESVTLEVTVPKADQDRMDAYQKQISDYNKNIELLEWQIDQLSEKQAEFEGLEEIIKSMKQQNNDSYDDLQALEISENVIRDLTSRIHGTFGSQLNDYVSQLLAMITDDVHRKLSIDEKFQVLVDNDRIPVQPQQLSAGTADQIYFAVRMAVSQVLFGEPMPLILDESFAMYDDSRLGKVLGWLAGQQAFSQVIIFSCHHREAQILSEMGCPYTLCDLS